VRRAATGTVARITRTGESTARHLRDTGPLALHTHGWALPGSNRRPAGCKPERPERCAEQGLRRWSASVIGKPIRSTAPPQLGRYGESTPRRSRTAWSAVASLLDGRRMRCGRRGSCQAHRHLGEQNWRGRPGPLLGSNGAPQCLQRFLVVVMLCSPWSTPQTGVWFFDRNLDMAGR